VVNFLPIMRSLRSLATDTCINDVDAARNLETQSAPANRGAGWCSVCGVVYSTPCRACRRLQDLWQPLECCRRCSEHSYVCSCAVGCKFTCPLTPSCIFSMVCGACTSAVVTGGGFPLGPSCLEEVNFTGRPEGRKGLCDLCSE
jgi:hypothetical protein